MKRHFVKTSGSFNRNSPFHVGNWVRLRATSPVHPGRLGVVVHEPRTPVVERVQVRIEGFCTPRQIQVAHLIKVGRPGAMALGGVMGSA